MILEEVSLLLIVIFAVPFFTALITLALEEAEDVVSEVNVALLTYVIPFRFPVRVRVEPSFKVTFDIFAFELSELIVTAPSIMILFAWNSPVSLIVLLVAFLI